MVRLRIGSAIASILCLLGFARSPSLDSAILLLPALMTIAILLDEAWDKLKPKPETMDGPYCPQCGYDIRAARLQCPECGTVLDSSLAYLSLQMTNDQ